MKIIDLLNKIANGKEVPKKIKYQDEEYIINKICLEDNKTHIDYYLKGRELLLFEDMISIITLTLNDEVEILEEEKKIPEKLGSNSYEDGEYAYPWTKSETVLKDKLNEIIDYLKSKGE